MICWIPAGSEAVWFATWWGERWWQEERWRESVPLSWCMTSVPNTLSASCLCLSVLISFPHRIRRGNTNPPSLPGWGRRNVLGDQKLPTNYHKVSSCTMINNYSEREQYIVDWDKKLGWESGNENLDSWSKQKQECYWGCKAGMYELLIAAGCRKVAQNLCCILVTMKYRELLRPIILFQPISCVDSVCVIRQ